MKTNSTSKILAVALALATVLPGAAFAAENQAPGHTDRVAHVAPVNHVTRPAPESESRVWFNVIDGQPIRY